MTEVRAGLPVLLFVDQSAFLSWLSVQPRDAAGAWLRIARKGTGLTTLSKPEAVDAALCHGWIDGQQDRYDADSWLTHFTPRKARSRWSAINRARALDLIEAGRIAPAGLAQIEAAQKDGRWEAAYAPASQAEVPSDLQAALDTNPAAASFFATLTGANRYAVLYRIGTVKRAETRARKIATFVEMLERRETIHG